MHIAITGATGLLGRNLLFEIIKKNVRHLSEFTIFVFSRPKDALSHSDRIIDIILNDGVDYIGVEPLVAQGLLQSITPISFDLEAENLNISASDFNKLNKEPIDYFFHIAAYTDFRSGPSTENKLKEINVKGTEKICQLIKRLRVGNFIYIGSAYSCGNKTGLVEPSYIDMGSVFRNPYEKTKLDAEVYFRDFVKTNKINYKIFRPSTICGRLIEKPLGRTNKYDVFYSWIAFFLREKMKHIKPTEDIYTTPFEMPIRLHFNPKGGLNIVPVDYCAKAMYDICINNESKHDYHLANPDITPNLTYADFTFKMLNLSKCEPVLSEPNNKTLYESLYYRTVGKIFTPYGLSDPIIFDLNSLHDFNKRTGIICPPIDKNNFSTLMAYAKKDYFGIPYEKDKKALI